MGGDTNCLLRRNPSTKSSSCGGSKQFRQLPYGAQNITVYTDEHGEAQASYTPGTGMFYDNVGAIMNDNGGCDLQGIDVIGTSGHHRDGPVSVPARDRPGEDVGAAHEGRPLAVRQEPHLLAQGPRAENDVARIVVAHAQNVTGAGFDHERVCFMADSLIEGMKVFTGVTGPASARISLAGTYRADDPEGLNRLCVYTNRYGNAAVEVFNSNNGIADVIADFVDEGILRSIKVNFNIPGSSRATPGRHSAGPGRAQEGRRQARDHALPAYKLGAVRLMNGKNGRYVTVRVNEQEGAGRDPRAAADQGLEADLGQDDHHSHQPDRASLDAEAADQGEEDQRAGSPSPLTTANPTAPAGVRP